ncbi:MAG: hypothetical protein GY777_27230 [Candidatus Brocadiaceae bacterium]|nr:hypothetical protein [Candidatus Brocadiaceae bacterium]
MTTAVSTFEQNYHGTAFFHTEKGAAGGDTHDLHQPSFLFDQKSDIIELSPTALKKQENEEKAQGSKKADNDTKTNVDGRQPSPEEQKEIEKIRKNSRNVKRRELVYRAVVGNHVRGAASFQYETGPDGMKYAIAGHTAIDTRPIINNPEASIRKAQAIKRTKIDQSVAVEVEKMEREARLALKEKQRKESVETTKADNTEDTIDTTSPPLEF